MRNWSGAWDRKAMVATLGPVPGLFVFDFHGYWIQIRKRCRWVFVLPDVKELNLLIYQGWKQQKEIKTLKYKYAPPSKHLP